MWKKNNTSLCKEGPGTFSLKQEEERRLCELRKLFEFQIKNYRTYLTKVRYPYLLLHTFMKKL